MKKLLRIPFAFLLLAISLCTQALESGQTIRLVNGGKSVLVVNSSLDENKPAVIWTETNVNSQRWTLTVKTNGTFLLSNDYTGLFLAALGTSGKIKVGQTTKTTANSRGSWDFVPVEGTTNQYRIYQGTTQKNALAVPENPVEGDTLLVVNTLDENNPVDPARITWTVEVVEPMAREFTKDKRDDMMEKWKARAYKKASTGYVIGDGGWWGDAEMFEIVLDALETTGDQQYATMFENLYTNFIDRNKDTWYQSGVNGYNEYNDDIAWMCIACVRAYLLTGTAKYRTTAKKNFDGMFARADCYGNDLLQWKHNSGQGTNSCINGPAAVCACYLAIATADTSYYQKARKTYMAERGKLFEMSNGKPTGKVFDSYDLGTGKYNEWASTYNQGTNLGAAIMLYNHYGEQMFKDDADAIIKWSEANLANSKGIIHVCQTVSGDLTNFKGIMLRYIRMYAESFNVPSHYAWLAKNAYHAWNNRNSSGITSSAWLTKAEEDFKHLEGSEYKSFANDGNMTCVSAAFNCHIGAVDAHDAYAKNEAEDFNFVRNAPVTYDGGTDDGGGMVGPMKSSNYIGYRRVDFGDKPASHIELRTNITLGSTGINVYLDQPSSSKGILLCNIKGNELTALKTWDTIRKPINQPVTGVHDIYFVSSGTGQTNINWWQFYSLNPVFADLTNGNGTLAASFGTEDMASLTDGDITTAFTTDIQSGAETWIQYTSPSPMLLYGYQLFSGTISAGDPRGWSLQASNDGRNWETLHSQTSATFSVRGERYNAELQTAKAYTHYRLLLDCYDTQTRLSLSEWQLLGRYIDQHDLTADGGTITEGCEPLIDHQGDSGLDTPVTVIYHTAGNYALAAYSLTAETAAQAPVSWKLEGSANGSTGWKVIDQQSEVVFPYDGCTNVYRVSPGTSYLYYRLTVGGESARLAQWQLFGEPDFGTYYADVTSVATIVASQGTEAQALIDDDGTTFATINGSDPHWDLTVPVPVKALGFSLVSANNAELDPQNFILYGCDESGTLTQISSKTIIFPARGSRLTYTVSTTKLFKNFRLQVTPAEGSGGIVRLADFELYGAAIAETDLQGLVAPAEFEASAAGLSTSESIEKVCDGNRTTNYRAAFTEPVSITYTFADDVGINAYSLTASKSEVTRDPASWTLEASNDGQTWTLLDSRSGESFSNRYATQFYSPNAAADFDRKYSIYRLTVTATNGGNQLQIGEFQLLRLEDEDPTGIVPAFAKQDEDGEAANGRLSNGKCYDLSGRLLPVSGSLQPALGKGIRIMDGKKLLVK